MKYQVEVNQYGTYWYLNGKHHREDGPAVERANGTKYWYLNGKHHRADGPAIEWTNGAKSWWLNGKRHREDGPAIEYANGAKCWFLNNEELTEKEFLSRTQVTEMTVEEVEKLLGRKVKIISGKD